MFKRRRPLSPIKYVRETLWPSMGWGRAYQYIKLRIVRLSDTSSKISAGLAIGVAVSFSPLIGTHMIQAALLAYFFRVNVISALLGTIIGNPWTFPIIWLAGIKLGAFLFELIGMPASTTLPDVMSFRIFIDTMINEPLRIFLPWMLGGYLLAFISWPICYVVFYNLVRGAKAARRKAQLRRVHKVAKDLTGQKK